ncbi:MAG: hypothetical protein CL792_03675 [Chloroflexi bacterium]|nr:hypothetical protein [Chloroflexota bacterium]|tara:strand:+ start:6008 stop:7039 length:1032 start_codon:yes stop_codon:yes gene_type:complete
MKSPAFGLNRFDFSTPSLFAQDVKRAESLGWDYAFVPDSQLRRHDTYVLLASAAVNTSSINLGTLLANPITRHLTVTAGSIATIDEVSEGRAVLGLGIGDTAVRLAGLSPAKVSTLEKSTKSIRDLLRGKEIELGAVKPSYLPHHRPVPVWIAAAGPRTLRAAGRVADGVFIRVGMHLENIKFSVEQIFSGAREVGRDPNEIKLGLVVHTILEDNIEKALLMGKSMAAGYYEYSPFLFDKPSIPWEGPDIENLKTKVHPDFHHHPDLVESGNLVNFLPDSAAYSFAALGSAEAITEQFKNVLTQGIEFDIIVPHPVPNPIPKSYTEKQTYMEIMGKNVLPKLR